MKIWHSGVTIVLAALLASAVGQFEGRAESKFLDTVLQYLESKEAKMMQNSDSALAAQPQTDEKIDEGFIVVDNMIPEVQSSGFHHIYSLNMAIPGQCCPDALKLHTHNSLRLCGKKTKANCDSIIISTGGQTYQEVRGKAKAYQFGSPDGFSTRGDSAIESNYVDGISITHGKSPRKHIWTYAIGFRQYRAGTPNPSTCPSTGGGQAPPGFVGDDHFCSSANSGNPGQERSDWAPVLYPTPLWSNIQGDCSDCGGNDLFFCVKLPRPTTDDLEVRICTDEDLGNEDIHIESMDFYIR